MDRLSRDVAAAIAVNRFGLGARPGELAVVAGDPRGWLLAQIARPEAFRLDDPALPSAREAAETLAAFRAERKAARAAPAATPAKPKIRLRDNLAAEIAARTERAVTTPDGFAERLVRFWSNRLTVAASKADTIPFAGVYEREAIRSLMTGRFADLHLAAMRHPGMLIYLDQARSIGPNSPIGKRRKSGLNENLAREALELHTLGAQGGYTQDDVTEFARALTGWTTPGRATARFTGDAPPGAFVFVAAAHEPGARRVLGKTWPDDGEGQARAILAELARRQATARSVATALARHFVADDPPPGAVARLEAVFLDTDGDLPSLHAALVDLPEAWSPAPAKFKTPDEFLISTARAFGRRALAAADLRRAYDTLGQAPFSARAPEGWPDDAASWAGPDAVRRRIEWSATFARADDGRAAPADLIETALGATAGPRTREAVARAESRAQGLTLALMSPEFQRR